MNLLSKTGGRRTISSESLIAGETAIAAIPPGAYRNGVDGDGSIFATLLLAAGDGDLLLSRVRRRLKRDSLLVLPEPEPLPLLLASESSEGLDREPAIATAAIVSMALAVLCWSCCIVE